jgi:endonuclease-3
MKDRVDTIVSFFNSRSWVKTELSYHSDYELLIAIILSAQCTDKLVNKVCRELFNKCSNFSSLSEISVEELDNIIHSVTYHHDKAQRLIRMAKTICDKYQGIIPNDRDILVTLPGVGRKSANLFLATIYDMPYIAVDTHVARVSNRLGLVCSDNPLYIENELMEIFEEKYYNKINPWFVIFGRYTCKATHPQCDQCPFTQICTK